MTLDSTLLQIKLWEISKFSFSSADSLPPPKKFLGGWKSSSHQIFTWLSPRNFQDYNESNLQFKNLQRYLLDGNRSASAKMEGRYLHK